MGLRSLQPLIPGSKPRSQGTARSPSRHQSRKRSPGGPLVAACDSCNKQDSAPRRPSRTAPYSWKPKQSPAWPRPARMTDLLSVPRFQPTPSSDQATPPESCPAQAPPPLSQSHPRSCLRPRRPLPACNPGDVSQPSTLHSISLTCTVGIR